MSRDLGTVVTVHVSDPDEPTIAVLGEIAVVLRDNGRSHRT